jgi:hypothetical protein
MVVRVDYGTENSVVRDLQMTIVRLEEKASYMGDQLQTSVLKNFGV